MNSVNPDLNDDSHGSPVVNLWSLRSISSSHRAKIISSNLLFLPSYNSRHKPLNTSLD